MLVGYFCFFVTLDSVTFSGQLNWSTVFTLFLPGLRQDDSVSSEWTKSWFRIGKVYMWQRFLVLVSSMKHVSKNMYHSISDFSNLSIASMLHCIMQLVKGLAGKLTHTNTFYVAQFWFWRHPTHLMNSNLKVCIELGGLLRPGHFANWPVVEMIDWSPRGKVF